MRISFRPQEILVIACQLERDGARFYRQAADALSDSVTAALLLELAQMEDDHLETFEGMKEAVWGRAAEGPAFDAQVALRYLQAVSNGHVVDFSADLDARLAGSSMRSAESPPA